MFNETCSDVPAEALWQREEAQRTDSETPRRKRSSLIGVKVKM